MSTTQERNESRMVTRLVATLLFVLGLATGYVISAPVQGATAEQISAEEEDLSEPSLASACVVDGLAFSDCQFDF